jgi:hypothetical protein
MCRARPRNVHVAFGEQVPNQNCRLACSRDSGNRPKWGALTRFRLLIPSCYRKAFCDDGFLGHSAVRYRASLPKHTSNAARYEPALGVGRVAGTGVVEWNASLLWAIVVSIISAIGIFYLGNPTEFMYWQF